MTAPDMTGERDRAPSAVVLSGMPLAELMETAQRLAAELTQRVTRSDFVDSLASVGKDAPVEESAASDGAEQACPTLTRVQGGLERLARTVDAARTAVAGHTDRVFESPRDRTRLLGLPPGKTGFRSSADFLEQTLQIPRRDARNRVVRAQQHLGAANDGGGPGVGAASVPRGGATPRVSGALWDGSIDPAAADLVARTLNEARAAGRRVGAPSTVVEEMVSAGEERLMAQALQVSPTTLTAICRRWRQRFDAALRAHGPDPEDPTAGEARSLVYRGKERGLHQWLLNLTDDQHEIVKTVASAGSNPRAGASGGMSGAGAGEASAEGGVRAGGTAVGAGLGIDDRPAHGSPVPGEATRRERAHGERQPGEWPGERPEELTLWPEHAGAAGRPVGPGEPVGETQGIASRDPRPRPQREVDAVISALQAALAVASADDLSATGGSRSQVLVTIDVETLTDALLNHPDPPDPPDLPGGQRGTGSASGRPITSAAVFTGPIDPRIIRAWACDADLIPAVLGGDGQVLDVGRAQRLFPLRLRRAIIARDRGCAAPGCSIPAPWCDVHHVDHWENGGPTSVDNGVLLCQHHHQAVHHGQWRIEVRNGVPWFQDTGPRFGPPGPSEPSEPRFERNAHWHHAA